MRGGGLSRNKWLGLDSKQTFKPVCCCVCIHQTMYIHVDDILQISFCILVDRNQSKCQCFKPDLKTAPQGFLLGPLKISTLQTELFTTCGRTWHHKKHLALRAGFEPAIQGFHLCHLSYQRMSSEIWTSGILHYLREDGRQEKYFRQQAQDSF